ncbi:MAG: tetratricopeptide repeat protein, partial [Pseudomonadota bacterium]
SDFDTLIAYCPNYAEGYNQRAFVQFLRGDFRSAVEDLDRALALSPRHIAAMSGKALSLMGLDRLDEARLTMSDALALNPWLPERGLAAPGGPLAPKGTDL